jgi:UDP-N-acetyl-D-galactosamine dehydrogenase
MGLYVANQVIKLMIRRGINPVDARVLVLGLTFKENCPDLRNSRVIDVIRGLADFGLAVDVHDPLADPEEARHEYGVALLSQPQPAAYDAVVLAVAHEAYRTLGAVGIRAFLKPGGVLYDVKSLLPHESCGGQVVGT